MKKYFKIHIIKLPEGFIIRKYSWFGWYYLDSEDLTYWWYTTINYSIFDSLIDAQEGLRKYLKNPQKIYYI